MKTSKSFERHKSRQIIGERGSNSAVKWSTWGSLWQLFCALITLLLT